MTVDMPSTPVNILLVDDKQENLFALEELLRHPDRTLFRATSGNDALRLLLKHEFAIVLLDVEMPGMDGYETAQLMRSAERTKLVPIIFVTAGDRSDERTFRGYEAGAVDFLYKPINAHTLKSKADVFIELYRKTRELQLLNATLERTAAALSDKIADLEDVNQTLSHDLRSPLRSIRGFSEVLAEQQGALDEEGADAVQRILRATARMTRMLDDLYGLLQLSAHETDIASVDTSKLLADVVESLGSDVTESRATVKHDELPIVRTNRRLVSQIFQNLIANSIKFRGVDQPAIHVSAERRGDAWQFGFRDNGIGIAPADRERVFRLFEKFGSEAGSGVGLTLCKRAVEKLGGKIWVGTETRSGATFYYTIPNLAARAEPRPQDGE